MTGLFAALSSEDARKFAVWSKGHEIEGMHPAEWRRDDFGHLISFSDYGKSTSPHGWEIDHIRAKAIGGSDDISNLRPLRCAVNSALGGLLGGLISGNLGKR